MHDESLSGPHVAASRQWAQGAIDEIVDHKGAHQFGKRLQCLRPYSLCADCGRTEASRLYYQAAYDLDKNDKTA
jgi:hypothetical protein